MSKSLKKIYDLTTSYRISRHYVNFALRNFYSKFIVLGKENIPEKGPVIISPNHQNALMDALLILKSTPHTLSNVFIARGDIFKKGFASKALRFFKILPAFRLRDGYENLGKNDATFDESREVLETKNALCIFPEGNQGDKRKLQPLVKGIFRIAFATQEQIGEKEDLKIIPVGIDYSDRTRFGEDVIINFGTPVSVSEYLPLYKENSAIAINQFREKLSKKMRAQIVDFATETHYDCFETAAEVVNTKISKELFGKNNTASRFYARQKIAESLVKMEAENPDKIEQLDKICAEYRKLKSKTALTTATLEKPLNILTFFIQSFLLFKTLPIFIFGFALNIIPFLLPGIIRKKMGVKYDGFFSSIDFVLGAIFIFPIFYLISAILFGIFSPFVWWTIPIFVALQFVSGKITFYWIKSLKKYANKIRYALLKISNGKTIERIQEIRKKIVEMVK